VDHARGTEGRWTGMLYGLGVTLEAGPQAVHLERSTRQSTLSKKRSTERL
jgi:hypothetical protein